MSEAVVAPAPARDPLRQRAFVGLLVTAFLVAVGFGLIIPVLPSLARSLGANLTAASFVISAFAAVRLLGSTPAGALGDRYGARPIVVSGLVIVSISSLALIFAETYTALVALRAAGGLGSALFITGIGQHLISVIPAGHRGRANGLLQGAFLVGGASGPALGALLAEVGNDDTPFLVYTGSLLAAALVARSSFGTRPTQPVVGGDDPQMATDLMPVAPADFVPIGERHGVMSLLRDPTFVAILVLNATLNFAAAGTALVGIPLFGRESLGLSTGAVGVTLTAASLAQVIVLWPAGRFADLRGRRPLARLGMLMYAVGILGLTTATNFTVLTIWAVVGGLALGLVAPMPAAVVADLAKRRVTGRAVGLLGVSRDVGAVFGPVATGFIADRQSFATAFMVGAGLLLVGFVAAVMMRETLGEGDRATAEPAAVSEAPPLPLR